MPPTARSCQTAEQKAYAQEVEEEPQKVPVALSLINHSLKT